jgi:hypothetical protein
MPRIFPKKYELIGVILIGIGVAFCAHQAVEDYKNEHIWAEAAEAEAEVEHRLRDTFRKEA